MAKKKSRDLLGDVVVEPRDDVGKSASVSPAQDSKLEPVSPPTKRAGGGSGEIRTGAANPSISGRVYQGLARKWRPQTFADLVGQEDVANSLMNSLRDRKVVHGHILSGPRGVGKTTSARILAKALNCEQGPTPEPCGKCRHCLAIAAGSDMDVLEIDAASNTQVDKMRELLESAARAAFSSRFKVYIIDEVHMLSPSSFNALLKTLEEPPSHVVFIFATTEYEKIPETVRSRCALHQFRRLSSDDIVRRLTHVARAEGIKLEEAAEREVYGLIAQAAEGGMRDALVALDQILAMTGGKPDAETAQKLLGLTSQTTLAETIGYLSEGNAPKLLEMVETQVNRGRSLEKFVKGLTSFLHDVMILQAGADARMTSLSGGALDTARELGRKLSSTQIFNMLNQFFDLEERMKRSTQTRFLIEFAFLRMAVVKPVIPLEDIIDRLKALPAGSPGLAAQPRPTPTPGGAMTVSTAQGAWSEASPETTIRGFAPSSPSPRPMTAFALHDSGAEPEPDAEGAVALATAAEPSGEVGERVAEYKSAPLGVHPLAGLSHEELIEAIAPQLPDTLQFLGRYLRSAAAMRATDSALWIQWPKDDRVASRMLAKPENKKALETALARMCGRPMTVHSDFAAAAASPAPPKSKGISPARSLNDSEPPADYSYADHEGNGNGLIESAPGGGPNLDRTGLTAPVESLPVSMIAPKERTPAESPIPAVTAEGTKRILAEGGELARRAKMVKDFFSGTFSDSNGQPVAV